MGKNKKKNKNAQESTPKTEAAQVTMPEKAAYKDVCDEVKIAQSEPNIQVEESKDEIPQPAPVTA
jgi:hypothetical protein